MSENERNKIIDDARNNTPKLQNAFKEKQQKLFERKTCPFQDQTTEKTKEDKSYTQKVNLTRKLNEVGGGMGK